MCFDKRVIAGLALAGIALLAINPAWAGAALPFLIVAVCPLSMLFMLRQQNGASCHTPPPDASESDGTEITQLREQVAELRRELAERRGDVPAS